MMKFKLYYYYCICLTVGPERVTAVTSSARSDRFTFEKIRDLILGEDVRRRSSRESSSESLYVIRGKKNIRDSGSKNKGRSQLKPRDCSSVTCWNYKEVGHFRMPK